MLVGKFALKCSINEYSKQCGLSTINNSDNYETYDNRFAAKFKEMIQNKVVNVQITQLVTFRLELEAIVTLYFLADDAIKLALGDHDVKTQKNLKDISFINSTNSCSSLKLNCIYYITRSLDINAVLFN